MSRFRFRLERVQRVREVEEELAKARYVGADALARKAEAHVDALRAGLKAGEAELRALQGTPMLDLAMVLAGQRALEGQRTGIQNAEGRAKAARAAAEVERRAWVERRQAVQSLERFEERSRDVFVDEQERIERAALDEAGAVRDMRLKSERNFGR